MRWEAPGLAGSMGELWRLAGQWQVFPYPFAAGNKTRGYDIYVLPAGSLVSFRPVPIEMRMMFCRYGLNAARHGR